MASGLGANRSRIILSKIGIRPCQSLGQLEFRGLVVKEGWDSNSQHRVPSLITAVLLLLVIGSWLLYRDWSAAWTVGCFFVALVALLRSWASYSLD
jgi:hypothetical protein